MIWLISYNKNASVENGTTKTERKKENYVLQLGYDRFKYTIDMYII